MQGNIVLRPAVRGDFAAVDALLARAYPRLLKADYPPSVLVTALPWISRARPELVGCGTYHVAESAKGIVAAGGWTPGRTPGTGSVRHVVTDDRHQRKGLGRALMNHALAQAQAAGVVRMDCLATRTAVPFYLAMGFTLLGPCEIDLAPGIVFPALRMERAIPAPPG